MSFFYNTKSTLRMFLFNKSLQLSVIDDAFEYLFLNFQLSVLDKSINELEVFISSSVMSKTPYPCLFKLNTSDNLFKIK